MKSIHTRLSWSTSSSNFSLHTVIVACLVAFLSYLAAELGGMLVVRPQMVWPLWPGCALLVAVLLLVPRRVWPILLTAGLAGFALYDLQAGLTLRSSGVLLLADAVEVLVATLGVNYSLNGLPDLNSVKSLTKYWFFAIILAPLPSAFIATAAFHGNYWIRWRIGFFTESLALLTVTPAILSWLSAKQSLRRKSRAFYFEAVTLIGGLALWGYVAFVLPGRSSPPALLFSLLPFLLWSALRFGMTGISTSTIVVAFLSIGGAVHGRGPFTSSEPLNNVMSLQLFLFFAIAPFMFLAVLVAEKKQTLQAFRESEKRFRLVADTAPVLIWMSDTDKLCTYFNRPWLEFTGKSLELEVGNGWVEGVYSEDLHRCMDTYTQAFDRREEFRMEYRLRRHDGEHRWILDIGVPRFDQDRSFIGYIGIGIDVTERKLAENELRSVSERLRLAMLAGRAAGWELDMESGSTLWFGEAHALLGTEPEVVVGSAEAFWERVHPEDHVKLRAALVNSKLNHEDFDEEFRVPWADGTVHWLRSQGRYIYRENAEPIRMLGVSVDVTKQKTAEQALARKSAEMTEAQRLASVGSWEWDPETDIVTWSEELYRIAARDPKLPAASFKEHQKLYTAESWEELRLSVEEALRTGKPYELDLKMVRSDGAVRWIRARGEAQRDITGRVSRLRGTAQDVTERKHAVEALRESEERFRLAAQAGKMYAYDWDAATDVVVRSAESGQILGGEDTAQVSGQQIFAAIHPDDRDRLGAAIIALVPEKPHLKIAYRIIHPDGKVVWVESTSRAHFSQQGKMLRIVGMVSDITDRKRTEDALSGMSRRLIEAQEQERARIARELHDDLGQRIALLANEMEQLQQKYPDLRAEVKGGIAELQKQTFQLGIDVQSLSHELHSSKLEYLGITAAMRSFCHEFGGQQKVKVDFKTHDLPGALSPDISLCLFRVLQEALHNSVKHSGVRHVEVELWATLDDVHLTVHDSGAGFDSEVVKESRGLGLISMEERLRLLNGTFSIESQPKRGTTVHARVPLHLGAESLPATG
jgi:PAS domain S-box-containing protein